MGRTKKPRKNAEDTKPLTKLLPHSGTEDLVVEEKRKVHHKMPDNGQNGIFAIQSRRKRVAELYLGGWTQWEISKELECHSDTVNTDLKAIQQLWMERSIEAIDRVKAEQLAKVDKVERWATEAYIRSMGVEEIHTESEKNSGEYGSSEKKVVRKQLLGDVRYLQQIESCIKLRCTIMGITDDKKTNINLYNVNWQEIANVESGAEEIENVIKVIESNGKDDSDVLTGKSRLPTANGRVRTHDEEVEGDE